MGKRVILLTLTLVAALVTLVLIIAAATQKKWVYKEGKIREEYAGLSQICDSITKSVLYCADQDAACILGEGSSPCRYLKGGEVAQGLMGIEGILVALGPIVYMLFATYRGNVPGRTFKNVLFIGALALALVAHITAFGTWGGMAKAYIEESEFKLGGGFYTYLIAFITCILNLVAAIFM